MLEINLNCSFLSAWLKMAEDESFPTRLTGLPGMVGSELYYRPQKDEQLCLTLEADGRITFNKAAYFCFRFC